MWSKGSWSIMWVLRCHPTSYFTAGYRASGSLGRYVYQHTRLLERAAKNKHTLKKSTEERKERDFISQVTLIFYLLRTLRKD